MTSWRTTIAGIAAIAAGVVLLVQGKGIAEGTGLIAIGIGLITAKDAAVHSTPTEVVAAGAEEKANAVAASK